MQIIYIIIDFNPYIRKGYLLYIIFISLHFYSIILYYFCNYILFYYFSIFFGFDVLCRSTILKQRIKILFKIKIQFWNKELRYYLEKMQFYNKGLRYYLDKIQFYYIKNQDISHKN